MAKNIIGVLPIPHHVDDTGRPVFDIDPNTSGADLDADFTLAHREVEAIKAEYGLDVPANLIDRLELLQGYKRALRDLAERKLRARQLLAEDVSLPVEPAAAVSETVVPDEVITPAVVEALDNFRVEGDEITDGHGNRYRRVAPVVEQAAAVSADELAAMAASVRPAAPVHPVLAVERTDAQVEAAVAAKAPLVAALGAFSSGQERSGDEMSAAQAAQLLHSQASRHVLSGGRTYLFRRDHLAPLTASLGVERLAGNQPVDQRVVARQAEHADALIAAFCGPAELNRDQRVIANTNRPIAQALAQANPPVAIGIGAHEFFRAVGLADLYAHYTANPSASRGLGIWTRTNQAAIDTANPATWKGVFTLPNCPSTVTVTAYFLWRALRVSIEDQMSRPQYVDNMTTLMEAMLARTAEGALLQTFDAWSFQRTVPNVPGYGALQQMVWGINHAIEWAASGARINRQEYDLIVPSAALTALRLDAIFAGEDPASVERTLLNEIGGRIVVTSDFGAEGNPMLPMPVQPHPDAPHGGNGTALPPMPNTWTIRLLPISDFSWGSTGVVDYGLETSPELRRQNAAMYFGESAEICYKTGARPSFTLTFEGVVANGARADRVAPFTTPNNGAANNSLANLVPAGLVSSHFAAGDNNSVIS